MRTLAVTAAALVALGGCRTGGIETGPAGGAQPAPAPTTFEVPAGTDLFVSLNQRIDTEDTEVGDRITATVTTPLRTPDGRVVIPQGAIATAEVTGLDDSDHLGDQAAIRLNFETIRFNGQTYPLSAEILKADIDVEQRDRDDVIRDAGIGAAAGAVLGAVIGGSLKDILIGAALGAGAGTVISLGTGDVEAALPAGTELTIRTTQRIALR
jgi:hypothetical protein